MKIIAILFQAKYIWYIKKIVINKILVILPPGPDSFCVHYFSDAKRERECLCVFHRSSLPYCVIVHKGRWLSVQRASFPPCHWELMAQWVIERCNALTSTCNLFLHDLMTGLSTMPIQNQTHYIYIFYTYIKYTQKFLLCSLEMFVLGADMIKKTSCFLRFSGLNCFLPSW